MQKHQTTEMDYNKPIARWSTGGASGGGGGGDQINHE